MDFRVDPHVEERHEVMTLGIRDVTPFRTMLAARDKLLDELIAWLSRHEIDAGGPFFLRLHVVDMSGPMDIEVGVVRPPGEFPTDERVRRGFLPAGRYATLVYRAASMPANRALFAWIDQQGLTIDRTVAADGESYGCRTETYLTDPRAERRKKQWDVELAFRLST